IAFGDEVRTYPAQSTITLKLNWQSFVNQGIPNDRVEEMLDALRASMERWISIAGLGFRVAGPTMTTATEAGAGELLVVMATSDPQGAQALAREYGDGSDAQKIEIYARAVPGGPLRPWVFSWPQYPTNDTSILIDIEATLTHEIGHALGLKEHSDYPSSTMCGRAPWVRMRTGPNVEDVLRARELWRTDGLATANRVRARYSGNSGSSWSNRILTTATPDATITTVNNPAAVRDSSTFLLAYVRSDIITGNGDSATGRHPEVIVAGDDRFSVINFRHLFTLEMSHYGVGLGGEYGEYMLTWVEPRAGNGHTFDFMRPRVLFSNNGGATWQDRSPPVDNELRASGTPAVHKLTANRWTMSFPVLDETNLERTGRVLRLESLNDGVSWTELGEAGDGNYYRTALGVSVTEVGGMQFYGFAWTPIYYNVQRGLVRAQRYDLNGTWKSMAYSTDWSRRPPSLGRNHSLMLFEVHRGPDDRMYFAGVDPTPPGAIYWPTPIAIGSQTTQVKPAMAADDNNGNTYVYYFAP
ncbi:MAG: hypothetical protein IT383_23795, partial [Deltaproteobacteria bacterium]|nr:hypothetical protein [Deltaproteobacteria bacterium]